jgi:orotate phosphoribosyltransferase
MNKQLSIDLAKISLDIGAIKLNPKTPFPWASGYFMPIYNNNRELLRNYRNRKMIADGFKEIIQEENIDYNVIAGTSTAGISPGTTLADLLKAPFVYVREKAKDHGLMQQVEGKLYADERVILIEDLISTGGSSIKAVDGLRAAGGVVNDCLSIFNYNLDEAKTKFKGANCNFCSLLDYSTLISVARKEKYINNNHVQILAEWRKDPWNWGANHGFPRVEK